MQRLSDLLYWMDERNNIRLRKIDGLPKPWSSDPVFQEVYFCNVMREDDKVTKWIRDHWYMVGEHDTANHLIAMCVARFVNKPSTLELLGYPSKGFTLGYCDHFTHTMAETKKPWGGAYIVSTNGRKMPKHTYIAGLLGKVERAKAGIVYPSVCATHGQLMALDGLGSFMAGQVVADLKNTVGHPLALAPDWWSWCAHGPGSLRGMAWLLGQEKCTPTQFYAAMPDLMEAVKLAGWSLHAQDVQNALCEFDKYMRVKSGTGRSKRKYPGKA